ncbi:DUF2214 family protein [Candidimonas sp. SYP-B2681]|uniref:DUF2214 family protein n=1 Tax=Candidimonas sp. SYP-B2681 TaxID=2497686 RepID=UPI000F891686|nr:DUF2214 family protein [Candidimonas sp. SYP-B2681]RTZ40026.1 DUF2214 family protein [Candidimonas sp. SYP-B2681]
MNSLFAFLHHIAAFTLVAALAMELALIRETLSTSIARKLQRADLIFGLSAAAVLVIGLLRVVYFGKGVTYYLSNVPFMAKLTLFIIIGVLSIYPTREFLSWRHTLKAGRIPYVAPDKLRKLRVTIYLELAALPALILCAALMARGVGSL